MLWDYEFFLILDQGDFFFWGNAVLIGIKFSETKTRTFCPRFCFLSHTSLRQRIIGYSLDMKIGERIRFSNCLSAHLFFFFSSCFLSPPFPLPFISAFFCQYQKKLFEKYIFIYVKRLGNSDNVRDLLKHSKTVRIPESSSTLKRTYKGIGSRTSLKNHLSEFTFQDYRIFPVDVWSHSNSKDRLLRKHIAAQQLHILVLKYF